MSYGTHAVKFKYTGTALPTGATTVTLFDSTVAFPGAMFFDQNCIARMMVRLVNSQAGTLIAAKSNDRGTNWITIASDSVAAAAANSENVYDFLVEGLADFRLQWTNGGVDQAAFSPDIVGTSKRVVAV